MENYCRPCTAAARCKARLALRNLRYSYHQQYSQFHKLILFFCRWRRAQYLQAPTPHSIQDTCLDAHRSTRSEISHVFWEEKIMVTSNDKGEYRTFCLWKMEWQTFAILHQSDAEIVTFSYKNVLFAKKISIVAQMFYSCPNEAPKRFNCMFAGPHLEQQPSRAALNHLYGRPWSGQF